MPDLRLRIVGDGPLRPELERGSTSHGAGELGDRARPRRRAASCATSTAGRGSSPAPRWPRAGGSRSPRARRAARRPWRPTSAATAAPSSTDAPGVLVAPDDLGAALAAVLSDDDLRQRLGTAALARARTLTWDAVGARRPRVLQRVVPDEPRRGRRPIGSLPGVAPPHDRRAADVQRAENVAALLGWCAGRCPTPTSSSSTTTAPTARPSSSRSRPPSSARSSCSGGPASRASAAPTATASPSPSTRATTSSSRWTSTSPTTRPSLPDVLGPRRRRRRRRHRVAVRARRRHRRLAAAPPPAVALGQPLHVARARPAGPRLHVRVPRLSRRRRCERSPRRPPRPRATRS